MSSTASNNRIEVEHAAGGLVWRRCRGKDCLAVVNRAKHKDWTLPKGRPKPGETPEDTAVREAMEETGFRVLPERLAGCYSYLKNGQPKVVMIWNMRRLEERYDQKAPPDEISKVVWLAPHVAVQRLTHPSERDFVARHCAGQIHRKKSACRIDPKTARVKMGLHTARERFFSMLSRSTDDSNGWWIASAQRSLDEAQSALECGDLDGSWGAVHDAERFMLFGMDDAEVLARATSLRAEANDKLKSWRGRAIDSILSSPRLNPQPRSGVDQVGVDGTLLRYAMVESLTIMNEHSDNLYHRLHLVGQQLNYLVKVCACLLCLVLPGSFFLAPLDSRFHLTCLGAVSFAGALGGVVSAMMQLSRVGETKIPEALLYGLITSGRPLVGAASALFVYALLQSGLISLIAAPISLWSAIVLGFAAGFSERFVLKLVEKVAGNDDTSKGGGARTGNGNTVTSLEYDDEDGDKESSKSG